MPTNSGPVSEPLPHLLPKDLPGAIRRLTDHELKKLFRASREEMQHRRLMPEPAPPLSPIAPKGYRTSPVPKVTKTARPPPVTQGKLNAIRAALKAGVKPNTIARQFGVTPAVIKKVVEDS